MIVRILNIFVDYKIIDYVFLLDINKYSDIMLFFVFLSIDLLIDSLVVCIIISLIGVFVFCFVIFVFIYMYFKCFWKINNGGVREIEG